MKIIGICCEQGELDDDDYREQDDFDLIIMLNGGIPSKITLLSGNSTDNAGWIIYFTPPRQGSLQFYSINPMILDVRAQMEEKAYFTNIINEKLALAAKRSKHSNVESNDLEEILIKINTVKKERKPIKSMLDPLLVRLYPLIYQVCLIIFGFPASLLAIVQNLIHRFKFLKYSNAAQQLSLRIDQFHFWPSTYTDWHNRTDKLSSTAQAQYIGFFNTVWLIINDIILGFALKSMIIDNRFMLSEFIHKLLIV
jgi:hypothetical protein